MVKGETKNKPSKVPNRTVPSDGLVITVDGAEYRPHQGETVTFRGRQSVGDALLAFRLQSIGEESDLSKIAEMMESIIDALFHRIAGWTWTNDDGEPYPSPPAKEDLRSLSFEELGWLSSGGPAAPEEDLKNE